MIKTMHSDNKNIDPFSQQVGDKAQRKLKAMNKKKHSVLSGLGMVGMVGWSVTVPTLLGVALGMWLDKNYHQSFSWTLNGLVLGIFCGCILAWHWVSKEHKDMNKKEEENE